MHMHTYEYTRPTICKYKYFVSQRGYDSSEI